MSDQLDVEFQTLPDDVFEQLMNDAPPGSSPNASALKGATKPEAPKEEPKAEDKEPEVQVTPKTEEELNKEIEEASDVNLETQAQPGDNSPSQESIDEASFFKAKAQGLIDRGIWQEFEGMESFEWNEENYGKLVEVQAEWKADEKYAEKVGKTGDYGKTILDHIENGGDPNYIINLFKASKRLESFDLKTSEGKENIVREYYNKVVGWSEAKTDKYVRSLIDSGEDRITEEATDAKILMDKGIESQIKQTQEAAKENQRIQAENAKAWEANITKTIKDREDLSDKERRELHEAVLNYNQKLPDGRQVNKFMIKFMEMQADPQKYIDLVRFVTNPDNYKKKVEKQATNEVTKKQWDFIKGNQSMSRSTGTSHSKLN